MANVQHAWWSAKDTCEGTKTSPDLRPEAIVCAERASADLLSLVHDGLRARGVHPQDLELDLRKDFESLLILLPSAPGLCGFLLSADEWDGVDRRWDRSVVQPLLLDAPRAGIRGQPGPTVKCVGLEAAPAAPVDVSGGTAWCTQAESVCAAAGRSGRGPGCSSTAHGAPLFAALGVLWRLTRSARRSRISRDS